MKVKKRRTSKELCIFIGLFLVIFVTIFHILLFSHTRAVSYYDHDPGRSSKNSLGHRKINHVQSAAENVARRTLSEMLPMGAAHDERTPPKHEPVRKAPIHHIPPRQGSASSRAKMRALAQAELRKMEKSLTALVRQNAPSPEVSINKYRSETSALRLKQIINQSQDRFLHNSETNKTSRRVYYSYNETGPVGRSLPDAALKKDRALSDLEQRDRSADKVRSVVPKPIRHFKDFDQSETYEFTKAILGSLDSTDRTYDLKESVPKPAHDLNITRAVYIEEKHNPSRPVCRAVPEELEGETQDVHLNIEVDIDNIIKSHSDIQAGGEWKPPNCISRHRLAIIIPYRDRWSHLKVLLYYLLPVLKRQQIHFRIFVVEQYGNQTFNKGRIMNAAYREALKLFDFQCVTFHDVDLVPEDDRNIYTCAEHPKHMSTAIDKFNYHLPYAGLVGGVLSFRVDHFQLVNGYSNMYWGWGGEDDDMTNRIMSKGLRIFRPPNNVARYKMVKHNGRPSSQIRLKLLRTAARRGRVEGLNNVPYNLLFAHNEKLFTHFMVDVGQP